MSYRKVTEAGKVQGMPEKWVRSKVASDEWLVFSDQNVILYFLPVRSGGVSGPGVLEKDER